MCFTAKPAVVCELSTRYEAAISISEASCMGVPPCTDGMRLRSAGSSSKFKTLFQIRNSGSQPAAGEFMPSREEGDTTCLICPSAHDVTSGFFLRRLAPELADVISQAVFHITR